MAGGTWTAQNKIRPGIYVDFKSGAPTAVTQGTRGTAAIPKALSWGPVGQVVEIAAGEDTTPYVGCTVTQRPALFLRELFKGTNVTSGPTKVLLYRLPAQGAVQASAAIGGEEGAAVTVTALYPGVRGNDVAVTIAPDVDDPELFTVDTLVDKQIVDSQQARTVDGLQPNGWVSFSGPGPLAAAAGVPLTGGADGTVQPAAYADALDALSPYRFDILAYDGTDSTIREAMASFVKRLAGQEGRHCQLVTSGAKGADSVYVINTDSSVVLDDGTRLAPNEVVWWLAGAEAGAQYHESISCAAYPGAADVGVKQSNSQIEAGIAAGSIVLSYDFDLARVQVETDIDTLTTYTPDLGKAFRKNVTMRVCSTLANDIYRAFSKDYRGRVKNDRGGRDLFKGAILDILKSMDKKGAFRESPTGDDVTVEQGDDLDSVVITVAVSIGDNVEKVYLTIVVS